MKHLKVDTLPVQTLLICLICQTTLTKLLNCGPLTTPTLRYFLSRLSMLNAITSISWLCLHAYLPSANAFLQADNTCSSVALLPHSLHNVSSLNVHVQWFVGVDSSGRSCQFICFWAGSWSGASIAVTWISCSLHSLTKLCGTDYFWSNSEHLSWCMTSQLNELP